MCWPEPPLGGQDLLGQLPLPPGRRPCCCVWAPCQPPPALLCCQTSSASEPPARYALSSVPIGGLAVTKVSRWLLDTGAHAYGSAGMPMAKPWTCDSQSETDCGLRISRLSALLRERRGLLKPASATGSTISAARQSLCCASQQLIRLHCIQNRCCSCTKRQGQPHVLLTSSEPLFLSPDLWTPARRSHTFRCFCLRRLRSSGVISGVPGPAAPPWEFAEPPGGCAILR